MVVITVGHGRSIPNHYAYSVNRGGITTITLDNPETITSIRVSGDYSPVEFPQEFPVLEEFSTHRYAQVANVEHIITLPNLKRVEIAIYSGGWYVHPENAFAGKYKIYAPYIDLTHQSGRITVVKSRYVRDYSDNINCLDITAIQHSTHASKIGGDITVSIKFHDLTDIKRGTQGWRAKAKREYSSHEDFEAVYGDLWTYLGTFDPDMKSRAKSAMSSLPLN